VLKYSDLADFVLMDANNRESRQPVIVAALYRFARLSDLEQLGRRLQSVCQDNGLLGTLLLATEGINGTVAGHRQGIDTLIAHLRQMPELADLQCKFSETDEQPFYRMKVRLKKEIVTMGVAGIDPNSAVGEYVPPRNWTALIADPEVTVVDTRNKYECHLGTFAGAIDPEIDSFREFPAWVENNLNPKENRKVAMFCTGGIRCEKATAYLLQQGFERVFHLEGGILKYLEEIPQQDSLWQGECFVFDNRVTVDHDLLPGNHEICFNCRMPIVAGEKDFPEYQEHVSCIHCQDQISEQRKNSLLERQKQVALARARGERHIGQQFPFAEPK
jgi:UPF0176 protein